MFCFESHQPRDLVRSAQFRLGLFGQPEVVCKVLIAEPRFFIGLAQSLTRILPDRIEQMITRSVCLRLRHDE